MEAVTSITRATRRVSTPRDSALRSPKERRLRSREKNMVMKNPTPTRAQVIDTSAQVRETKLPINQKMITATCSSARYLMKLSPAARIAATMMPERIRLLDEIPPPAEERKTTIARVATAPIKAKTGTAETPIRATSKSRATAAPKAAPADTPRV